MKIAFSSVGHVVYGYATGDPNANGGLERLDWLFARALARAGWSVTVAVPERLPDAAEDVVEGVRFVGMGPVGGAVGYLRAWSKFLDREKPDWWYWQGADPLWGVLLLMARMRRVRTIFSAAFDTDVSPRKALTRRRVLWPLYSWGLRSVDRIFVQHSGQLEDLARGLQKKAEVLPGVVSLRERVQPASARGDYIAWVAVVRKPKRPDLLIEIARKAPDLRFVVCGGTSTHRTPEGYSERMVAELKDLPNVDYRGQVDPSETLEIIGNARALLSTSDGEGFPSTFLEAWSSGTPVVSLQIDPGGVIREKGLGFVSGTPDRAIEDMRNLLDPVGGFDEISGHVRDYAEQVHTDRPITGLFERVLLSTSG